MNYSISVKTSFSQRLLLVAIAILTCIMPNRVQAEEVNPTLLHWYQFLPAIIGKNSHHLSAPKLAYPGNGTLLGSTHVSLRWTSVPGGTRYRWILWVENESTFTQSGWTENTVVELTDLAANREYSWRVKASNPDTDKESSYSDLWTFKTPIPAPTPLSPTDGSTIACNSILLSCNQINGATTYHWLYRAFDEAGEWKDTEKAILLIDELTRGKNYSWYVYVDANGVNGPASPEWSFTVPTQCGLTAPILTSPPNATIIKETSATLRWQAVPGASRYYWKTWIDDTIFFDQSGWSQEPYITVNGLAAGQTYTWKVKASNPTTATESTFSTPLQFSVFAIRALETPVQTSPPDDASFPGGSDIKYMWDSVPGAEAYKFEMYGLSNYSDWTGKPEIIQNIEFVGGDSGVFCNAYTWRVKAIGNGMDSNWSPDRYVRICL